MNLLRLRHLFLFLLCVTLTTQGMPSAHSETATNTASNQITLQLKWYHQFQFAGYYAAQLKGYYRDEGLNVTLVEGSPKHPPLTSILERRATYGVSDSDILIARLQGKPLVVMAAIFQHAPYILMTRLDRGITHPRELVGRKVMVEGEQGMALLKAMFLRQGVDWTKVKFIPHTWNIHDLVDGKADAITAYYTTEPAQMQSMGAQPGIMRAMDYGVDFYGDTLFTLEEEVKNNPARAAAFLRATVKGWRYAFDHTEEIIQHILQMPSVQQRGITAEMLRYEADKMQQLVLPNLVDIGSMSTERWQRMARLYTALGLAPNTDKLDGFVYNPDKHSKSVLLKWVAITCGSVFGISLLVGIWTLQMQQLVRRRTRELAEQNKQLAISEASYREMFNIANDAIFVHDLESFRILDVNSRACELFGYERNELLTLTVSQITSNSSSHAHDHLMELKEKVITQGPQLFEWHCLHHSGHEFWSEVHLKRGTINGEERLLALVRDITERRRLEEDRLKVSKLDALGVIAGGIAHDLNNIMLGIILNLDLLLNQTRIHSEDAALMRSAKNAALRASDLSRRMLTFAKGGDPIKKNINIRELIINSLNLALRGSSLLGSVQIEPNLPTIQADPGQIAQVLDNLIINAREASPGGGNLFIRGRSQKLKAGEIHSLPPGDYLLIEVQDQGTGIPEDVLPKIFDPYFTTKKSGHGIGLATCYSIMKKHGGDILVHSLPGQGTTFSLYLPIQTKLEILPDSPPAVPTPMTNRPTRSERLLIIDDDSLIRKTLVLLLKALGYQHVEAVENGEAGLVLYQKGLQTQTPFDLVILDATIPGYLGGEEAFKALRELDPKARVILSSGYSDSSTATNWKEIGFCAILPKPFTMQDLEQLLNNLPPA